MSMTTCDFIFKSKKVQKKEYGYDLVAFTGRRNYVTIVCYKHGPFQQSADNHLAGYGCSKCKFEYIASIRALTTELFVERAKVIHGDRYDYSKSVYIKRKEPVIITCKLHGDFLQTANGHLNGNNCRQCKYLELGDKRRKPLGVFIEESRKVHGDLYDYSLTQIKNSLTKTTIICRKHGPFEQTLSNHINGGGCKKCALEYTGQLNTLTLKEVLERANKVHNFLYDYSKVVYLSMLDKIEVICKKHGEFLQSPLNHLQGSGCPECNSSRGELAIARVLNKEGIKYIREYILPEYKLRYRYDFYLPDYDILIEFQGGQHYFPIEFFGGEDGFVRTKQRDRIKKDLAISASKPILYFNYKHLKLSKAAFDDLVKRTLNKVINNIDVNRTRSRRL